MCVAAALQGVRGVVGCLAQAQAGEDGDLLPGLLALTQSWLEDVPFSSFRRVTGSVPPLDSWFSAPQVTLYLKVCLTPFCPILTPILSWESTSAMLPSAWHSCKATQRYPVCLAQLLM